MSAQFNDFLKSIKNKNIAVVGVGISNTPIITMLAKAGANVKAFDKNEKSSLGDCVFELESLGVKLVCGKDYLDSLDGDIVIKTPGMRFDNPALVRAKQNGAVITSEMELFFEYCPCKIIAVTGSDGKTTTTSLIYEMLKASGKTVHLGGNIGMPLLPRINDIDKDDIVVAELSSFQLHTMKKSANTAVVTNLSPNHLDVHKSMQEYTDAKTNIFKYQSSDDLLILNGDNEITNSFADIAKGRILKFSFKKQPDCDGAFYKDNAVYIKKGENVTKLLDRRDITLRGDHNVENFMAAILAVLDICSTEHIVSVANNFGGVRHRIEFVRELNGVKFYNDSIGSSPTRTIATLRSFEEKVILIAGGYDKQLPFDELGKIIPKHVKALFLTGATAQKIKDAVTADLPITVIDDFDSAVRAAADFATAGDSVLLSPACASFDKFKNFEVRGDRFVDIVNNLME